jgi:predicted nucleic acid-binding protein
MKVLFDTSVLVPAALAQHPHHAECRAWIEAAFNDRIQLFVSCHSLAEFYRVLTSIKASPQFTTAQVWHLLSDGILRTATIVELTQSDYCECLLRLSASARARRDCL